MSEKALVSVIIPLYNAEAYIAECIRSVQAQTWPNIEIIIIDDGSTDKSYELAKAFEGKNIKVFQQANQGASIARNNGLSHSNGEFIQFLDADDILSNNKIAEQMSVLNKNDGFISVCDTVHFADGADPYKNKPSDEWYKDGSFEPTDFLIKLYGGHLIGEKYGGMIQPNAWLTSRRVIDKAGLWNEMRSPDDDGEYFCRVILASKGVCYAPNAINYYRKFTSTDGLSAQKSRDACKSVLAATDLKAMHLLARTNENRAKAALSRLYWENAYSFYPSFAALSREAEKKAKHLYPDVKFTPYNKGLKFFISKIFGWKSVRYLIYLKHSK